MTCFTSLFQSPLIRFALCVFFTDDVYYNYDDGYFEECGRALSVAHFRPSVRPCVRLSLRPFVHHLSGYFVSATPPTILSQSF